MISFSIVFLFTKTGFTHGVTGAVRIDNAVIAEIRYDDGEPFSYSQVKIYSPDNRKTEYLNSRTDAKGVIAFLPDKKGVWRIVVTDSIAHGKELDYEVKDGALPYKEGSNWSSARKQKLQMSILLLWAIISTSLYLNARIKLKEMD